MSERVLLDVFIFLGGEGGGCVWIKKGEFQKYTLI